MSVWDGGYQPEDYSEPTIEKGEHQMKIFEVKERVSKNSGNELIEIKLKNKNGNQFFFYIVKNDFFNRNLTRFYDCFGIERGERNFDNWLNRYGWAYVDKGKPQNDGNTYMEIKYLVVDHKGQQAPAKAPPPKAPPPADDGFTDDIPF
jgi:hypothetical protein